MYQHRANFALRDGGGDDDHGGVNDHDHDEHVHVNMIDVYFTMIIDWSQAETLLVCHFVK